MANFYAWSFCRIVNLVLAQKGLIKYWRYEFGSQKLWYLKQRKNVLSLKWPSLVVKNIQLMQVTASLNLTNILSVTISPISLHKKLCKAAASRMLMKLIFYLSIMLPTVNFINIKRANFSYEFFDKAKT